MDDAGVRGQGHRGRGQGPGHQRGEAEEELRHPEESQAQVGADTREGGGSLTDEVVPAEETDVDKIEDEAEEKTNTATGGGGQTY